MDTTPKPQTAISFCTGLRGIERGIEELFPLRTVVYVEIEAFIVANLVSAMEYGFLDPAPIWTDCKTFDAQPFRDRIFMFTGGYPCQPFSRAGKRSGTDDPRHLWPHLERHIRAARPICCFFENVSDHLSLGFPEVATSLRSMGYRVEAGLFSAAEVGGPHERERLFILAVADTENEYGYWCHHTREWWAGYSDCSQVVDDAGGFGLGPKHYVRPGWYRVVSAGKELVNTDAWRLEGGVRGPEPRYVGEAGEEMADPQEQRFQRLWSEREQSVYPSDAERIFVGHGREHQWPAGQGECQYPWEAKRTIEPRLGCTINGYNFREDLLRALGNGVVEQTAAKAYFELSRIFLTNKL